MKQGVMHLLPPRSDLCQDCATAHDPAAPHNAHSLYYQTAFNMKHGRAPNWQDAMAHCTDDVKSKWAFELALHGIDVAAGDIFPPEKSDAR